MGEKPLSEPMLTWFTDSFMRHYGRGFKMTCNLYILIWEQNYDICTYIRFRPHLIKLQFTKASHIMILISQLYLHTNIYSLLLVRCLYEFSTHWYISSWTCLGRLTAVQIPKYFVVSRLPIDISIHHTNYIIVFSSPPLPWSLELSRTQELFRIISHINHIFSYWAILMSPYIQTAITSIYAHCTNSLFHKIYT